MDSGDLLKKVGYGHSIFVDRVGDTFRWKGENVATAEVEAVLNRFPGVQESTVYGISRRNVDGKPGMAAIACDPNSLDISGLYSHCRADLPEYAVPMYLRLQTALQHTGTFKHERYALRELGLQPCPDSRLLGRSGDQAWALL